MSLYLGFLSVSFITLIHAFWFVALAVAERIAMSPLYPTCLPIDSTWFSPTSCVVTWLTNTLRASAATSESMPTTLMPRCAACLSAGATASGSLPAMMIASGFCWTAALMIEICDDALASVGPVILLEPPSSFSASSTPECSNSSYGLPSCLGIETVFRPCLISASGLAASDELLELLEDDEDSSSLVEPQAENASAATSASAANGSRRADGRADFMTWNPPPGYGWSCAGVPR